MPKRLLTPPRLLLLTYIMGAGLGFVQGLLVARLLGAAGYGIVGILVTLGGVAASFWDVRLIDLATKLHYAKAGQPHAQSGNMRLLIMLNATIALLMSLTTFVLIWASWHYFTETAPEPLWVFIQAATIGIGFIAGTVQSLQRLANAFYIFALSRLLAQVASFLIVIGFLWYSPNISGYYDGLILSNLFTLLLALCVLGYIWRKAFGEGLLGRGLRNAWQGYRGELRFVFSANIFSYSKILTRSGDVLLFGYFASDAATGIYRLARALADSLNIFVDAVVQYYNPRLMQLQAEDNKPEFDVITRKFFKYAALATLVAVPGALISLTIINTWFLHGDYPDLGLTTAILASNFIWIAGVHPWLWPAMVHHNEAHRLARNSITGALVQAAIIAGLCYFIAPWPELAALGAVGYYLTCYPALLIWWKKR